MGCQKGCTIFWCFLFMLSGLALLGTGIWMMVFDDVYDTKVMQNPDFMSDKVPWNGTVGGLMAVGIYTFLIGILGMAGAGCGLDDKVHNSLIAFAVLASFGVIAVIIFSSLVSYKFATTEQMDVDNDVTSNLFNYYMEDETNLNEFEEAWNRYQLKRECCGVESYIDYEQGAFWNATTGTDPVPWTCCVLNAGVDAKDATKADVDYTNCIQEAIDGVTPGNTTYINSMGCGEEHWDTYRTYQTVLLAVGWTCVFVELVAMFVSGCLRTSAGEKYIA